MGDLEFERFSAHFSATVSQGLVEYVTDVALLHSRYLFTRREGKRQFAYCTHCHQDHETDGLRHGETETCPSCGSTCRVRASGRGRKYLVDDAYVVYYEKSAQNPEAITARGIYVVRDYREDYREVKTEFAVRAMYVFAPGESVMYERYVYYAERGTYVCGDLWSRRKTVWSLMGSYAQFKACFCSNASIVAAVQGTPFQYSTWERYNNGDRVKFFDLAAKYPCIEYLTKLGFSSLVEAKLYGYKTYGVVNWRGRNPLQVLRMTKQDLTDLRSSKVDVTPWFLRLYQISRKDGSKLSIEQLDALATEVDGSQDYALRHVLHHTTLRRVEAYLTKQLRTKAVYTRYHSKGPLLAAWHDYINDCTKLGMDLTQDAVLFPSNLHNAHQNTIEQVRVQADALLDKQIAARCLVLQKYRFEASGFILRPAASSQELIDEGKALHHCVGTYAKNYADGRTNLFVIRRAEEPDKPFYTLEIYGTSNAITQCRGLRNCSPTDEVKAFLDLFRQEKLLTKKHTKVEVAV